MCGTWRGDPPRLAHCVLRRGRRRATLLLLGRRVRGAAEHSSGWLECTGSEDEPHACQCVCGANGCPWDAELEVLVACEPTQPCGDLVPHREGGAYYSDYDECILASLRDRTPGRYATEWTGGLSGDRSRALLGEDEQVQFIHYRPTDLSCFEGALYGMWEPTLSCTLKPAAFFEACLAAPEMGSQCLFGDQWFDACETMPASCP